MVKPILMSIKPRFSHQIITQKKDIEIRKKIGKEFLAGNNVFIYSTSPEKKIIGSFQIDSIFEFDMYEVTAELLLRSCLSRNEMLNYIKNDKAYAIKIKNIQVILPISLEILRNKLLNFRPPQSYMYINTHLLNIISNQSKEE
ncbi:hypothetical protein [Citrobacter portucalensis]|uniref:hypothetical protein n=1 Tax=Citrobacter portucalensis TaxID=1639133 RepID=UPI001C63F16C|nr:hypothetical protein [Citrobacter portucalensis]MBW7639066.1 hypothetical protein [Citrobacter portucalensis]